MSRRNQIVLIVMLLVGILIFGYSLRDVKLSAIFHDLATLHWRWFLVAVICIVLYLGLEGVVVKVFMADRHPDFTFKNALRVPLVEQLFNGITPFSTGGQPAQLIAMMQSGVDAGQASSVLLMKFVVFQAMIVINFLFSLMIGFHYIAVKLHALSLLVVFGFLIHLTVIVGLLMIMYWHGFTKRLVNLLISPIKWFRSAEKFAAMKANLDSKIDNFYQESLRIKSEGVKLLEVVILTFFQLLFYYLIPYFIMLSLGVHGLNLIMVTSLHILIVMIISLFPIPGGAGGAEYSFSVLFSSFIGANSKLVLAMLLWRLLTYYFGMFAGMFALVIKPDKIKSGQKGD
ncbi:lysylphosphatidylglycerol synthase transmembrane domain-containing protein [Paucilactobacillus wasatchensis]|uniref:Phosphatidylglycerol lysyltransferase n=1 Tax=Paucilactobacillus wasatchensis TaxID=1335616 RepID=A0A0D1A7L6_9LACO|nr:lysylphosphatidylglycerol synthase transmembrane domain-containing protein [Paucilactobacillus wasatchensis]KIS02721.1 Integral membrane protein LafC [Paucilactobacillus wasatchensis]